MELRDATCCQTRERDIERMLGGQRDWEGVPEVDDQVCVTVVAAQQLVRLHLLGAIAVPGLDGNGDGALHEGVFRRDDVEARARDGDVHAVGGVPQHHHLARSRSVEAGAHVGFVIGRMEDDAVLDSRRSVVQALRWIDVVGEVTGQAGEEEASQSWMRGVEGLLFWWREADPSAADDLVSPAQDGRAHALRLRNHPVEVYLVAWLVHWHDNGRWAEEGIIHEVLCGDGPVVCEEFPCDGSGGRIGGAEGFEIVRVRLRQGALLRGDGAERRLGEEVRSEGLGAQRHARDVFDVRLKDGVVQRGAGHGGNLVQIADEDERLGRARVDLIVPRDDVAEEDCGHHGDLVDDGNERKPRVEGRSVLLPQVIQCEGA